jgi:gephyrin
MMAGSRFKVALLIVSTTASQDPSTDASQVALADVLETEGGDKWELLEAKIVPDVVTTIQQEIKLWADAAVDVNLILTTGGTGFATSDHTPEVSI